MARLTRSIIGIAAALACGAAAADPVSLAAFAASAAGAAGLIAPLTAFAVTVGVSVLGTAAARRKARRQAASARAAYNASLTDRTVTALYSEAPWQIVYGSPAPFAGSVVAILTSGDRDEYQHLVYVFAAHECEAIDELYIDGVPLGTLEADGWVSSSSDFYDSSRTETVTEAVTWATDGTTTLSRTPASVVDAAVYTGDESVSTSMGFSVNGSTVTADRTFGSASSGTVSYTYVVGASRVNAQKHLSPGGVDTADAFLMARVPDKWTPDHKLSGFTYVVLTVDLNDARFQAGPPNLTAKIRGKKLYDPRTGLTTYSANPVLARMDFIMAEYGFGASLAQIESATAIASANACDTAAYTASDDTAGTTVLYSCDGVFSTEQDREVTLQQLEECCGGVTYESGGVWRLLAGYWEAPILALGDADVHGPMTVVQAGNTSKERFNGARGRYVDWRNLGVSSDFTPYVNSTFLTDDGIERNADLSLPFTSAHQRAQQLSRLAVERSRGGLIVRFPMHMRAWHLQPGDRITLTYSEFGFSAKNFRLTDWTFNLAGQPVGEFVEDESSYYDLADEITTDAAPNTTLADPYITPTAPIGLTASSGTDHLLEQGGTVIVRCLVEWSAPLDRNILPGGRAILRWRPATTDGIWTDITLAPESTSHYLTGLPDGQTVLIGLQIVNTLNVPGQESVISHYVVGKTESPSDVTSFAVDSDGLATWTAVSDVDVRVGGGYRLRWQPGTNRSWGDATPLHEGLVTQSPYPVVIRPSGTATFLVKAVDSSGNESANVAASVVSLGDPIVSNVVASTDYQANGYPGTITGASVSGGELVADADASPLAWDANEDTAGWTYDTDAGWTATTYQPITYVLEGYSVAAADDGSQLTLLATITATAYLVSYRRDGDAPAWTSDAEPGWTSDSALGWDVEDFRPWPGAVTAREGRYEFQITTQSRDEQSLIGELVVQLDVPDVVENVGTLTVLAAGTVVPITKTFRAVTGIGLTLVADGGTAVTARVESLSTRTVTCRNAANTGVDGTVLATVQGY